MTAGGRSRCHTIDEPTKGSTMGEKGNGGHVATGGARAVREATSTHDTGLGGSHLGGNVAGAGGGGGGGLLGELASQAEDHVTDAGGAVVDRARDHHDES